ncbi:MAG: hypothetical protein KC561_15050, partial [Myxococcales bacterium]|nr:hypothetical protein [Myxococcales bacterium]
MNRKFPMMAALFLVPLSFTSAGAQESAIDWPEGALVFGDSDAAMPAWMAPAEDYLGAAVFMNFDESDRVVGDDLTVIST